MVLTILSQFGIGVLGILIYNVFAFRKYLKPSMIQDIGKRVFWDAIWLSARFIWIWTLIVLLLLSLLINVLPETASLLKEEFGLDIAGNLKAFLLLGFSISAGFDKEKQK